MPPFPSVTCFVLLHRAKNIHYLALNQSKDCPICSWVNKKGGEPSLSFEEFTPKKKSKGIVFYEDRITELIGSPHLARGANLLSPMRSVVKKILLDDIVLDSGIVTPAVKVRKPRALKLVAVKIKVEEKIKETGFIKSENSTDDVKDSGTPTPRAKRMKKGSVTETAQNLNFITPTLDSGKAKRQPRKIKSLDLELLPKILKTEEVVLKFIESEASPLNVASIKIEEEKLSLETPTIKRSYKRKNGK